MAIPKKGSRSIDVDGRRFRWHVRRKPTYAQALNETPLSIGIALEGSAGCVLHVSLDMARPDAWLAAEKVSVTPRTVSAIIRNAIGVGWMPQSVGPTFAVTASLETGQVQLL